MRRRRFLGRLTLAVSLAMLSLAASGSLAAASVTLGQLAPGGLGGPPAASCKFGPVDFPQLTVASGNSYVVPGVGTITSWSHNAGAGPGQMLTMKVFRKVADPAVYTVIGHDGPRPLAGSLLNTFPASIPVKPGDLLGLNDANATAATPNACDFPAAGTRLVRNGDLADGQAAGFYEESGYRGNVTAVFVPTNTFALGAVTSNKKKGTATLTVNVPNPGELTGSGKGVKVASAAVISKTVIAPGEVKLTIKAKGKKRRTLNETGKVKVKPKITYTPTGGDPSTESKKVKLKKL
jgi:hypothetical protein